MEHSFWHARWRQGRIGFHAATTNPYLAAHWNDLDLPSGSRVLVPLCGKSLDMLYLRAAGHEVVGAELSPMACEAFFVENQLSYHTAVRGSFMAFEGTGDAAGVTLLCGDFNLMHQEEVGQFDAFFDRASVIALPPQMRDRHVATISRLVRPGGRGLVNTLTYPEAEHGGPPFAIGPAEVQARFGDLFVIEELGETSPRGPDGSVRWGLSWLKEHQFAMTRRGE